MDPDACLAQIKKALSDGDILTTKQLLNDLDEWLSKGGFPPSAWTSPELQG